MNININVSDTVAKVDLLVEEAWRRYLHQSTPTVATVVTTSAMNVAFAPLIFKAINRRTTQPLTPKRAQVVRAVQGAKTGLSAILVVAGAYELYRQYREKQALEQIFDESVERGEVGRKAD